MLTFLRRRTSSCNTSKGVSNHTKDRSYNDPGENLEGRIATMQSMVGRVSQWTWLVSKDKL
jgi:hypothetical protein